jgi:predicted ATPase/DNA-binding NarL/FixJ family response regulator/transcriptional regulator with XRE-family HTH domain
MTSFGSWLRARRTELQLTQAALAERAGCAPDVLRQFESEVKRPSVQLAERLADALDIPAADRASFIQAARGDRSARDARPDAAPPALPQPPGRQPHAPKPQIELIGRDAERNALRARLRVGGQRLVTLVGPGGIGKTSLALQVAADLAADTAFAHAAAVVLLAPLAAANDLPAAIVEALGESLQGARSIEDQLLTLLRERTILLVLDNCEHLLGPGDGQIFAQLIRRMLDSAPGLHVLATSRERLRLRDERLVALGGLGLPAADTGPRVERADAVRLFVDRAQRVAPDFFIGTDNRSAVAQICRRLEGLPLAIELAASWTRVLTPGEIAAELERSLDFLAAAEHDAPARHRSLRAALDHSWLLLDDRERAALACLSVFHGGFDRDAAEAVCAELKIENGKVNIAAAQQPIHNSQFSILNLLAVLVDKSLLQRAELRGSARYSLHELVRQYAEERLACDPAELSAVTRRHAAYYSSLLQRSIAAQTGGASPEALANLTRNVDNVRAVWIRAAAAGDTTTVLALARNMMILYDMTGRVLDGAALFERAAAMLRASGVTAGAALGVTLGYQGYYVQLAHPSAGAPLLEQAIALLDAAGDSAGSAQFLVHLGTVEIAAARLAAANQRNLLAEQLATANGDQLTRLWAIFYQGVIDLYLGDHGAADQHLTTCLDDWRAQDFNRGVTSTLSWLSEVARQSGRLAAAAAFAREGLQISSTAHDMPGMARSLRELGALALDRHDLVEAHYLLTESCTMFRAMGGPWAYGRSRSLLVRAEVEQGQRASARQGCAELLRLVRNGAAIMLPEAAYGLARLLVAEGDDTEALAVLGTLAGQPGEQSTLALATALRGQLEARLDSSQRAMAEQQAQAGLLIPWLEELCARPSMARDAIAPAAPEHGAQAAPAGAQRLANTNEALSAREIEVLSLVARGASNSTIAARLIISPHTVKRHVANICQKLGVATRTEAAVRARELGIVV